MLLQYDVAQSQMPTQKHKIWNALCNIYNYWNYLSCSIKHLPKILHIRGAKTSITNTRQVPGVFAWNVPPLSPGRCNILSSSWKDFVFSSSFSLPKSGTPVWIVTISWSRAWFNPSEVLWPKWFAAHHLINTIIKSKTNKHTMKQKQTRMNVAWSRKNWVPKVCIWRLKEKYKTWTCLWWCSIRFCFTWKLDYRDSEYFSKLSMEIPRYCHPAGKWQQIIFLTFS